MEILYATDDETDIALHEIKQTIAEYSLKKGNMEKKNSISINVSDSSNVNIVSNSSNVTITQELKKRSQFKNRRINRTIRSN